MSSLLLEVKKGRLHVYALTSLLIFALLLSNVFPPQHAGAATYTWTQTSWADGTDGGTLPVHPTNQSNWTKYSSKDTNVSATAAGLSMATSSQSGATQTNDTDFGLGTHSSTITSGSGSGASVALPTAPTDALFYWPLDEASGVTATDSTGNGHTLYGLEGNLKAWSTGAYDTPMSLPTWSGASYNNYAYALGGQTTSTVYYAALNGDGTTGAWQANPNSLPLSRLYNGRAIAYNGYLYYIGGWETDVGAKSVVYYAAINGDGTTGAWSTTTSLPAPRMIFGSLVANGFLYVVGGWNSGASQSSVYYAPINGDGTLGSWVTSGNSLPSSSMSAIAVAQYNGYMYAIGSDTTTVYYAALNGDGSIGSWATNAEVLPTTRPSTPNGVFGNIDAFVINGYIYTFNNNYINSPSIRHYAKINGNATTGPWAFFRLPEPNLYTVALQNYGFIYSISGFGGSVSTKYTSVASSSWTGSGKYNSGLTFDGVNNQTNLSTVSLSPANTLSFSAWLNPSNNSATQQIFDANGYDLALRIGGGNIYASIEGANDVSATISTDTWTHIVFTYDGSTMKIYKNGAEADSATHVLASVPGNFHFAGDTTFYNGSVDDVRVYNRVLTDTEILNTYNIASSGTYTSGVIDFSEAKTLTTVTYNKTTPTNTTLTVDVRAGNVATPDGTWTSWATSLSSGGSLSALGDNRYVQYRLNLATSVAASPSLEDISINYLPPSVVLTSSAYDADDSSNALAQILWSATTGASTTVQFQLRTAPDSGGAPGTYTSWMGPDGTSGSYFTDSAGGETIPAALRDGLDDQWVQYRVTLATTDGAYSPSITSVTVKYVVNAPPDFNPDYPTTAAGGATAVQNADGTVTIGYSVRDPDGSTGTFTPGYISPSFEFSTNGGSSWTAIATSTLGVSATANKAVEAVNYTTYTATWYAGSSTPSIFAPSAKIRVTANDNEPAHGTTQQASAAFTLDTTVPNLTAYTLNVGAATITLAATDDSLISYRLSNNADFSADGVNATSGAWQSVGASSTSQTISWVFAGTYPEVHLQMKDAVTNQIGQSAVAPQTPQSYELRDISNITAGEYKEFIDWGVYTPASGATFGSYKVQRSTNDGASFSLLTSIADQNQNYYIDTGLATSTTYTYKVQVMDSNGDTSGFTPSTSDLPNGQGGTDVAPPLITAVSSTSTQSTAITIIWTTDELSSSVVEYSTDQSFGLSKTVNTMVTSHSATLTSLTPATQYYYRVRSVDVVSNSATDDNGGGGYTFTTSSGPVISNVTTPQISDSAATVSWDTNTNSDSYVVYADNSILANPLQVGTSALVGGNASTTVFQHSVDITDLTAGQTYYYYVKSTDAQSNESIDNNGGSYYSFHTTQDVNGPVISSISTPVVAADTAVIVWQTDELSTSQVGYGTASTSMSTFTALDSTASIYHIVTLTGLSAETPYYYAVRSKDLANNETVSDTQTLTTTRDLVVLINSLSAGSGGGGGPTVWIDGTPPVISSLTVKDLGAFKATVSWKTDENTRSFLELTDEQGKKVTFGSPELNGSPEIALTGLRLGGKYSFVAKSVDVSGNLASAPAATFTTKFVSEAGEEGQSLSDITDLQDKLSDVIESSLPSLLPPVISDIAIDDITGSGATITWNTNIKGTSLVALAKKGEYHADTEKPYPQEQSGQEEAVKTHTVKLQDLEPNTLYNYQVRTKTLVGTLGKGPNKTFSTKAGKVKPAISGITSTSFIVSWTTDEPTTSVVEYKNVATGAIGRKTDAAMTTKHELTISDISQGVTYDVSASGLNADGNSVSGESVPVKVIRDVTAPTLSGFKVESFMVPGRADRVQTVVSWQTDEPATSVVEYSEGAGTSRDGFDSRYENLKDLGVTHTVALLNLKPETVYEIQVTSADQFGNKTVFGPRTVITPKQAQSIIDVIFSNFNETFKFIENINP